MALVRISRLSVQPVTEEEWQIIYENGGNGMRIMKNKNFILFILFAAYSVSQCIAQTILRIRP